MLILGRKPGEAIVVPQCELTVTVLMIECNKVRLAFSAPDEIDVYREEVWQKICNPADRPSQVLKRNGEVPDEYRNGQ